uniref:Uncharacterized protein n=1 Tax=Oryza glumipatula TaxID=40148 RepID=A0A0E0AJ78_9ORYZ
MQEALGSGHIYCVKYPSITIIPFIHQNCVIAIYGLTGHSTTNFCCKHGTHFLVCHAHRYSPLCNLFHKNLHLCLALVKIFVLKSIHLRISYWNSHQGLLYVPSIVFSSLFPHYLQSLLQKLSSHVNLLWCVPLTLTTN